MIYSVYEVNEDGSNTIEFFNERKDDANKYFKQRLAICDGIYKTWKKEKGINYCKWTNGKLSKEIFLRSNEFDNEKWLNDLKKNKE